MRLAPHGSAAFVDPLTLAELAQLVEQRFRKAWVVGSSPMLGSILSRGKETALSAAFRVRLGESRMDTN